MAILRLTGSVGSGKSKKGIPHNELADVIKVRDRLIELGYQGLSGVTNVKDEKFLPIIKLFQCICKGICKKDDWLTGGDKRVDRHGTTHKWLAAQNAPGWVHLVGKSGVGWQVAEFDNGNEWGTTWMLDRIHSAGRVYKAMVAGTIFSDAPPMWIRDCANKFGGKATGHKSHRTGLDLDMRLPLLPPDADRWDQLSRKKDRKKRFDREAALLQVAAIKQMMDTKFIFFNDQKFINAGWTTPQKDHDEHYHIRINPPVRIEGVYM